MDENLMLETGRKRLRRWIESQGQVFSDDPAIVAATQPVFLAIQGIFSGFWECVTLHILALSPCRMIQKIIDTLGDSGSPATPVSWRKWGCYPLKGCCKAYGRFWRILED